MQPKQPHLRLGIQRNIHEKETSMKRTLVSFSIALVLAIAILVPVAKAAGSANCGSCCNGNCGQSCCQGGCDDCCQ